MSHGNQYLVPGAELDRVLAEADRYREALEAARRLERAYEASGRFDRHFVAAFSEFLAAMAAVGGDPE